MAYEERAVNRSPPVRTRQSCHVRPLRTRTRERRPVGVRSRSRPRRTRFLHRLSSDEDISVSTLWTPSGEYEPSGEEGATGAPTAPSDAATDTDDEYDDVPPEVAEELRRVSADVGATPAAGLLGDHPG